MTFALIQDNEQTIEFQILISFILLRNFMLVSQKWISLSESLKKEMGGGFRGVNIDVSLAISFSRQFDQTI